MRLNLVNDCTLMRRNTLMWFLRTIVGADSFDRAVSVMQNIPSNTLSSSQVALPSSEVVSKNGCGCSSLNMKVSSARKDFDNPIMH